MLPQRRPLRDGGARSQIAVSTDTRRRPQIGADQTGVITYGAPLPDVRTLIQMTPGTDSGAGVDDNTIADVRTRADVGSRIDGRARMDLGRGIDARARGQIVPRGAPLLQMSLDTGFHEDIELVAIHAG